MLPIVDRIHRHAFAHYLRTGERLTNAEWLARSERKFNPYHDERGRFTSPPGATVSWGDRTRIAGSDRLGTRSSRVSPVRPPKSASSHSGGRDPGETSEAISRNGEMDGSIRSDFVRNATIGGDHAETYFELNRRQASLNRLREAAGPRPSAVVKADLDEIQKRYDADRARLDARQPLLDTETNEILRAGSVPSDVAFGAANIATGKGRLRDLLSTVSVLPFGAILRRTGGLIQLGGAQAAVRRLIKAEGIVGVELHHVPSKASLDLAGIAIPPSKGPVIVQLVEDHRATRSWGSWGKSQRFRKEVADRLARGDVEGVLRMEFDDIERIKSGAYGYGAEDVARYIHDHLGKLKR